MIGLDGRWEKLSSLIGCAVFLHKSGIYTCAFFKFVYFNIFGLLVSKPLLLWIITKHIITNQGLPVHRQNSVCNWHNKVTYMAMGNGLAMGKHTREKDSKIKK